MEMIENREVWRRLGSRIAEMRRSWGPTQFQLAEMTGLSESYIGFLEQGIRNETILTYLDIVTALGYSLNDLVDVHRAEIPPELALELSDFFTACTMDERTSIVRIFREMLNMIRTLRKTSP